MLEQEAPEFIASLLAPASLGTSDTSESNSATTEAMSTTTDSATAGETPGVCSLGNLEMASLLATLLNIEATDTAAYSISRT